jgi:signal transduction histidine kinase
MILTYLKKFYLPTAAIVATVLFTFYYNSIHTHDYQGAVADFQDQFIAEEERLDQVLEFTRVRLNSRKIEPQWESLNGQEGVNIHIYRNDSLVFWNTNQLPIIRFADIHFPANGLVKLQNGWYFAKTVVNGDYLIGVSFLIRNDYAYENQHLVNDFSHQTPFPYDAEIIPDKDRGFPVYNKNGDYVCSILVSDEQPIPQGSATLLFILLLTCIITWVALLHRFVRKRSSVWSWSSVAFLVGLRIATQYFDWFSFMEDTDAVNPALYGVNDVLPNFLAYTLHVIVIVYVFSIIRTRIDAWKPSSIAVIASYILPFFTVLPWVLLLYLTVSLVENSTIPLGINHLFSLNTFSILSIVSFGVLFYEVFLVTRSVISLSKRNKILGSRSAVIYFAVSCLYLLYEINSGFGLLFASLFPMMYLGAILYQVILSKNDRGFGSGLFVLFCFAVTMSVTINELEYRKERGEKELFANQLATEKDIVTEAEYGKLAMQLKEDKFLNKLIKTQYSIRVSDFQENLERRFFNGFWERYELKFSLFNERHLPIVDKVENSTREYDALQQIIERSGVPSEIDSNIFFVSDYQNQYSYIIRQKLTSGDSTAILFCTLKSTKIPEEIGFPRLLISGSATVFENLDEYSIAKYHGDKLLNKYGDFNYPTNLEKLIADETGSLFVDFGGFNHFVLQKSPEYTVVLSSENPERIEEFTAFSYLFSFYGLMLLPLLFRMNRTSATRRTMSLALKIQLVLIALVFLSLLAFGWGSGVFVSNQHKEYTRDVVREKLSSVNKEVGAKLGTMNELNIDENGDRMQFYLEKFSRVFFTDINLYDKNGYLLATSRPKVFNSGLISEQMNPAAYAEMRFGKRSEYIGDEHIGALEYSSAYKPFYNEDGKLMAYINLQHFGQQNEFENQIQKFLVAIVNVFVLLLALSILIAIFVSNWLTAPLRILQESFSSVRFGTHNERISYSKEDEIGSLVKDYNQKLEELEFAAQKLARSERESAWREMAKQVAHEIKNPLTPMRLSVQHLLRSYDSSDPKSEEKLKRVANSIIEQIDALTNIANEFSNFAKMPLPEEERLNIIALIRSAKQVFVSEGVSVKVVTDLDVVNIRADRNQMIRVFNNLIKNAIQATPEDRSTVVSIYIKRVGSKIQIDVEDNGVGIAPEKKNKIFTPYFTTKSTGTGLGLAMVRQIVENHHGSIDFDSEEGKGTTFTIMLPADFK